MEIMTMWQGLKRVTISKSIAILCIAFCTSVSADEAFFSFDPSSYFESGYHLRGGIDLGRIRYSAMSVKSDRPLFTAKPEDHVSAISKAVGADIDYIGKESKGVYFGGSFVRVRWIYTHDVTGARKTRDGDLLGPRVGYRHYFKPWFFVDGRINCLLNMESNSDLVVSGASNKISGQYVFPFLELGFAF